MSSVWAALQASDLAVWLSFSRWGYAAISTVHVLSISALLGTILTLDLRLIGLGRSLDPRLLAGLAVPVAGTALLFAVLSGAMLFAGRATEYAGFETFQIKMALLVSAVVLILFAHGRYGFRFDRATPRQRVTVGALSLMFWVSVGVSGRMIAFVHG